MTSGESPDQWEAVMLPLDGCMPANCLQMTLKMAPNLSGRTSASVNKSEALNLPSVSENEQLHMRSQRSMRTLAADSHMQSAKYEQISFCFCY